MKPKQTILLFLQKWFKTNLLKIAIVSLPVLILLFPIKGFSQIVRQSKIEFISDDGLLITADHYYSNKKNPYILLFHTETSSRGEFELMAERFCKMHFNCLAVDLRSGSKFEFVKNLTAEQAMLKGFERNLKNAEADIKTAIHFADSLSSEKLILLGSSSSASLCLKVAKERDEISAVMALSPGEFFQPEFSLEFVFSDYKIPVYITGNQAEISYLKTISSDLKEEYKTIFSASENTRGRGTALFMPGNPTQNEYWMSVLIFVKSLKFD